MIKNDVNLYKHQQEAIQFVIQNRAQCCLFMEMGLGKTLISLYAYYLLRKEVGQFKMFVVCPLSLIHAAWIEDCNKFSSFKICNLRKKYFDADIYVINYEMLITKRYSWILNFFKSELPLFVLDEATKIKNPKAKMSNAVLSLASYTTGRLVLTGTPTPNSLIDIYNLVRFVSPNTLPSSYYAFRNKYFHLQRGSQVAQFFSADLLTQGFKLSITPEKQSQVLEMIKPFSIFKKKKDCLNLPDQIDLTRSIDMGKIQSKMYKDMINDFICSHEGQDVVAQVALTKLMKARQITSGFAISESGSIVKCENPKLTVLKEILNEQIPEQQVIIWANFRWEIEMLLKETGGVALYGGTKNREEVINDFKSNKVQYLVANPRSAGHGLTFTNCSYQIFFSLDYSAEHYEQAKARTHRIGQKEMCINIHLICQSSIDQDIYQCLKEKRKITDLVHKYLNQPFKEKLLVR